MKLTKFGNTKRIRSGRSLSRVWKILERKGVGSMLTKFLSELKPKERGRIVKVGGGGRIHRRLLDMGLVSGSEVEMERVAPLGDPVEIRIKGYHLSLRREEAANVQVEVD